MERKLITIAALDVVGFSRRMERDETGTLQNLKDIRSKIIEPCIERHSGRVVKLMGDGALVEFPSVVGALQSSVEIQKDVAKRNQGIRDQDALWFRIGLHLGDVIVENDDIYGDGVNVASRLESIAGSGGIVLSKQVYDHIGANVPMPMIPLGEQTVKNINRPIEVYRVDLDSKVTPLDTLSFSGFELDTSLFELRSNGERISVEPRVFDLLVFLARNQGRTVTKDELFQAIWGDRIVSDAALSGQISAARRALGDDGASQRYIATVHGRGFRFVPEVITAGEMLVPQLSTDPEQSKAPDSLQRPAVAVLPFSNLNHGGDEDYLADGISEDINTAISKNRWLAVIARNPSFAFRHSNDSLRSIGKKLNADYIVSGTVRIAVNRVRITAQLVDAQSEQNLWSERFDRSLVDIFDLQDEISELVASRLEAELGLTEQRKAVRRSRENRGAWDLYQLGTAEFYKFTPKSNATAQDYLRKSIELDPEFAGAHSRLAYAITLSMVYFDRPVEPSVLDDALASAIRAVELDDQDAGAFFTLGRVYLARCEYDKAIDVLQQAIDLNPCLAVSYCGLGDSLAYEGRLDEALENFEIAIKLSPHDPFRWAFFSYRSLAHLFRGEYEEAVSWARQSTQVPNAQYWAWAHLTAASGHLGDTGLSERAVNDLLSVKPNFTPDFAKERLFYLKRSDQIETYIEGLRKAGL